jgi:hypothetical protein
MRVTLAGKDRQVLVDEGLYPHSFVVDDPVGYLVYREGAGPPPVPSYAGETRSYLLLPFGAGDPFVYKFEVAPGVALAFLDRVRFTGGWEAGGYIVTMKAQVGPSWRFRFASAPRPIARVAVGRFERDEVV